MSINGSAVALGFFDGVHIAHQEIICHTVEYSKINNLSPLVLSFDRSPREILYPGKVNYLTSNEEKEEIISSLGAPVHFLTANKDLLQMDAETFVKDVLVKKYNIRYAVCGYNYRFGKDGKGDTDFLISMGKKYGFKVKVQQRRMLHGESISSNRIRTLLAEGKIEEANELLGRNYSISGTVCEGKHLGRILGFPTANVFPEKLWASPKSGVYKTLTTLDGKKYNSITNTGINPTVGGETPHTETHIPSLEKNLYGKKIKIEFIRFIRGEKAFPDIESLKEQIEKDITNL